MRLQAFILLALSTACGPSRATIASADEEPADQWSRGVYLYGQHCAGCHGENGEGDEETPPLSGKGALPVTAREGSSRRMPFHNAADVFRYTREQMPQLEPGSLSDDQYWAVLAYALKESGI